MAVDIGCDDGGNEAGLDEDSRNMADERCPVWAHQLSDRPADGYSQRWQLASHDRVCNLVTQELLLRNCNLEKHPSDMFDHFQLHLALDRFLIVSADPDLLTRTSNHQSRFAKWV